MNKPEHTDGKNMNKPELWVTFDGSGFTGDSSDNVIGVHKNGVGDYTIDFNKRENEVKCSEEGCERLTHDVEEYCHHCGDIYCFEHLDDEWCGDCNYTHNEVVAWLHR